MSDNNPLADLLRGFSSALGTLGDAIAKQSEGGKPRVEVRRSVKMRSLDGSSGNPLDDLQEIANRLKENFSPPVRKSRTLQVEVHEEGDEVLAVIQQPGLKAEHLEVAIDGDMLELRAEQADGKYHGEALLPCAVKKSSQTLTDRAGMIELRWQKLRMKRARSAPKRSS